MLIQSGMAAYVTGAGSGIGRGIARRLSARGVRVGICDIRADAAEETAGLIRDDGGEALALSVDVSDAVAVEAAADEIEAAFGPVSIVCNNAGVAMHGRPLQDVPLDDWSWVIGVNLMGVVHGVRTFVPRLLARGAPAHVVNTASIGGFQVNASFLTGPYSTTKFAVVALSEALRNELGDAPIGVSILGPAGVDTGIHLSGRSRPDRLGGPDERPQDHFMGDLIRGGMSGDEVGEAVARAIESDTFYIFTHPETREWLERRHAAIMAGFDGESAARAAE